MASNKFTESWSGCSGLHWVVPSHGKDSGRMDRACEPRARLRAKPEKDRGKMEGSEAGGVRREARAFPILARDL